MPALLTSTSTTWNRATAVSRISAAVVGVPMSPSTRATRSEAAISADCVTFLELATTLKPRSTNAFTIPAPIPCEAPVTIAVFRGPLIVVPSHQDAYQLLMPTDRDAFRKEEERRMDDRLISRRKPT